MAMRTAYATPARRCPDHSSAAPDRSARLRCRICLDWEHAGAGGKARILRPHQTISCPDELKAVLQRGAHDGHGRRQRIESRGRREAFEIDVHGLWQPLRRNRIGRSGLSRQGWQGSPRMPTTAMAKNADGNHHLDQGEPAVPGRMPWIKSAWSLIKAQTPYWLSFRPRTVSGFSNSTGICLPRRTEPVAAC